MYNFLQLLDKGAAQILAPLKRFPLASFSIFVFILMIVIQMSFQVDHSSLNQYDNVMEKVAIISAFGFFFLIGLRLMARNFILPFLGMLVLVGIYFYLPEDLKDFVSPGEEELFYPMLIAGLISFMIVAPFIMHKASNREFFEWLKLFVYATFFSVLLTIVLFVILTIGTKVVIGLFDLGNWYEWERYISFFSFVFLTPYLFLSFLSFLSKDPRTYLLQLTIK